MTENNNKLINWRWIAVLTILPVLIGVLYIAGVEIYENYRYDNGYFSAEYAELYDTPGAVARSLEAALQSADTNLIAELNGMRANSRPLESNPNLILTILLEVKSDYYHYLYFDMDTFKRYPHYIKEVDNRWVHVPGDIYYFYDSGEWMTVYTPIAIIYWVLVYAVFLGLLFYRLTGRARARIIDQT